MNLHELTTRARAGQIECVNLVCLEGGSYLIEAKVGPRLVAVLDEAGQPVRVLSLENARDMLKGVPIRLELDQAQATEEMCGMPEQPLRRAVG